MYYMNSECGRLPETQKCCWCTRRGTDFALRDGIEEEHRYDLRNVTEKIGAMLGGNGCGKWRILFRMPQYMRPITN